MADARALPLKPRATPAQVAGMVVARLLLVLVALSGCGIIGFGGWIAWRGVFLYANDPVLMGTGGGLAIGGLLVVALTVGAGAQLATARHTAAMRDMMEAAGMRDRSAQEPATGAPDDQTP